MLNVPSFSIHRSANEPHPRAPTTLFYRPLAVPGTFLHILDPPTSPMECLGAEGADRLEVHDSPTSSSDNTSE